MSKVNPTNLWQYGLGIFLIVASLVALVVSWSFYSHTKNMPAQNTITVSGEGKIFVKPDVAVVEMSVVTQHKDVKMVQSENDKKMQQVVNFLKESGIEEKDIKTLQYNLQPQYDYSWCRVTEYPVYCPPKLVDYILTQSVQVKIRDLSRLGEIVGNLASVGINQISSIDFIIDKESEFQAQARKEAIANAQKKAFSIAEAANVKLGKIVGISESINNIIPRTLDFTKQSVESAAGAPIETGSNEIIVNISLTYELIK